MGEYATDEASIVFFLDDGFSCFVHFGNFDFDLLDEFEVALHVGGEDVVDGEATNNLELFWTEVAEDVALIL